MESVAIEKEKGIGPSEAIVVMHLSKRKSPVELFLEKTGEQEKEPVEESAWSKRVKEVLAEEFTRRTGLPAIRLDRVERSERYLFMVGVQEFFAVEDGEKMLLDVRRVSEFRRKEFEPDKVPVDHLVRLHHNMEVFGYRAAYLVVLIGGVSVEVRKVEKDDVLTQEIIRAEREFWGHVERKEMIPLDGSTAAKEWLKKTFAETEESEIQLPKDALELIERLEVLKEEEKVRKEEMTRIENQLKYLLGKNERGRIGTRLVQWVPVETTRLDQKALKADHPDLFEKYSKKSVYRRFSLGRV